MKAVVATGKPEPLTESLETTDVAEPDATADQAIVAVQAFSVNRGEALALTGGYGVPAEKGWRPGQDIAGHIAVAAADGSGPAVGARVVGHSEGAGWAERVAVSTSNLAELPDSIPGSVAAALPLAGLTALRLLRDAGNLTGRRVLITGASGGVGHYLTELAAGNGAEVTAVTASPERGARLAELGAASVVHTLAAATAPYDLILESVGGQTFSAALALLKPGGNVLWYGQAGLVPITLDFFSLIPQGPFTLKQSLHWISDTTDAEDLATLVALTSAGRLHPEIGRTENWAQTAAVLEDVYERRIRGNAILTIAAA